MAAMQIFRLISLHHFWRNKLRTMFVLFVIMVGCVSMFIAVDAIYKRNDSRRYGTTLLHGRASISIEGNTAVPITTQTLDSIRTSDDIEVAAPIVMDGVLIIGQSLAVPVVGIDPDVETQVRPYIIESGSFITEEGQILITDVFAENISVGDTIRLGGKGGIRSYTVVGILAQESIAALNGGDLLFLHYRDAQDIRGRDDFNFVSVVSSNNPDEAIIQLQTTVPEGVAIENLLGSQEKSTVDVVVDILGIISNGIPAILGALMITSTMSASIAQRRKEIAILRSLGVTQGGVQAIFIVEAAIVGLVGSLLGVALASLVSSGGLEVIIEDLSATATNSSSPVWVYGLTVVTGVLMGIGAMWLPARKTAQIDPAEAMRHPVTKAETSHMSIVRIIAGISLIVLAVIARIAFDNSPMVPMAVLTGILFVIMGAALLFPPLMVWISQNLSHIMRRLFGFSGLMAAENLNIRHQRMLATGLTSLVVIWFSILGASFSAQSKYLTTNLVNAEYNWDIIVSGPGEDARTSVTSIPVEVVEAVTAREDVAAVVIERQAPYTYQDTAFTIRAIDLDTYVQAGGDFAWEQGNSATAFDRLREHNKPAVLVGGFEALMFGLRRVGEIITLPTPNGDMEFEVVGTINSPAGNTLVMDYSLYTSIWNDIQVDRLSINLTDNADAETVRRSLSQRYAADGILVADRDEIRALFVQASNAAELFISIGLLPFMMIGIANMLFISVLDRQREFGMLRAIGTLRHQITWSVVLESVVLVGMACLVAVPAGYLAIDTMLFTRITGANVRPDLFIITRSILFILIAGAIAGYLPARRAGRLNILEALHYE